MTTPSQRADARMLLDHETIQTAFAAIERRETEAVIAADEDETRARHVMQVRAIRALRQELEKMAREPFKPAAGARA